jgi:hypothetical protein
LPRRWETRAIAGASFGCCSPARPDLLPIDIKRQGRAEVHIPLFYPYDDDELRQMFVMLAKKLGTDSAP